jgi:predicted benzoate:H+ symporter BenE
MTPLVLQVGYEVMTLSQSLRITGLPFLSFPGTALLSKELSRETMIEVMRCFYTTRTLYAHRIPVAHSS